MGNIGHHNSGQLFTLKTQISFQLLFLQFDNLLFLYFYFSLMGNALLFNHPVLFLLHRLINNVLQQQ